VPEIDAVDEWLLKEVREPVGCVLPALHNFCRIHRTLREMPAMEAGIADHVWVLAELFC
jgi:hypothetical protein